MDAEALLLVDYQEPQVFELQIAGKQPVGADDDVHRTVGQTVDHPAGLGGSQEAGEHLHPEGVARETVGEGLEVL